MTPSQVIKTGLVVGACVLGAALWCWSTFAGPQQEEGSTPNSLAVESWVRVKHAVRRNLDDATTETKSRMEAINNDRLENAPIVRFGEFALFDADIMHESGLHTGIQGRLGIQFRYDEEQTSSQGHSSAREFVLQYRVVMRYVDSAWSILRIDRCCYIVSSDRGSAPLLAMYDDLADLPPVERLALRDVLSVKGIIVDDASPENDAAQE